MGMNSMPYQPEPYYSDERRAQLTGIIMLLVKTAQVQRVAQILTVKPPNLVTLVQQSVLISTLKNVAMFWCF